jgi:hypothetical protein
VELRMQYPAEPEFAAQHAELAVSTARSISHVHLDYSVGSLKRLDGIIEGFRRERVTGDQIRETLFTFGCYLGEVLIRHYAGEWRKTEKTSLRQLTDAPLVVQLGSGNVANPIDQVLKRLQHGKTDSLPHYYQTWAARAEGRPDNDAAADRKWWQVWKR